MTTIGGRVAVVTGAGNGIGKGLALALGRAGAAVAAVDLDEARVRAVAEAIVAEGGRAVAIGCDVSDRAAVGRMRDAAVAALGPVTLVFANAGVTSFDPLTAMSDDDVDWVLQVNLMGTMNTIRAFLPAMIAGGEGGHVVATSSINGLLPGWAITHVPYVTAKAGIIGLMMNLALELEEHRIGTTTYCPGGVASAMKQHNARYRPDRFGGPGEEETAVPAAFSSKTPPFFLPDQVAPMVLRAVERGRPFVFDHPEQRRLFRETYADVVEACFDDAEAFEREHGRPASNPGGPVLEETP